MDSSYILKMRPSESDWRLFCEVVRASKDSRGSQRSWLRNRLIHFVKNVAPHILQEEGNERSPINRQITIVDISVMDSSLLETLFLVAAKKQKPVSQIIQKYVIDFPMVLEEFERFRAINQQSVDEFYKGLGRSPQSDHPALNSLKIRF